MNLDVLTKVPVLNNRQAMFKTVTRQQQFLHTMLARMKAEKTGVDDLLKSLEDCLINDVSSKLVTKYKRCIPLLISSLVWN
jgi:hypothetical protein